MRNAMRDIANSLGWRRKQRRRQDFQQVFGTQNGERVLMHLYERCFGKQSTWPPSGDPLLLARNEGMRTVLLMIVEELRKEDMDLRRM